MLSLIPHILNKVRRAFLAGIILVSFNGRSQTILHVEDFESGSPNVLLNTLDLGGILTGENPWVINNVYLGGLDLIPCVPPVILLVPPTPPQPPGITNFPNSTYLHVTPQSALDIGGLLPAASYVVADGICLFGGASTFSHMSSDINTIGHDSVTLDLWWMCGGSDNYYGEVYYSTDGGAAWLPVNNPLNGTNKWKDELTWTNTVLTDPNWDGQATLRFGFRFISGSSGTGTEMNPGFALDDITVTGHDVCVPTTSTIDPETCDNYTSPSGTYTWDSTGVYQDTLVNADGCDSLITINLTVNTVDVSVTQDDYILIAGATADDYEWIDCNNGHIPVAMATNQTFAPVVDGSYAVVVSQNGCVDTSGCITVVGLTIDDLDPGTVVIHPNPAREQVIVLTNHLHSGTITITDLPGRILISRPIESDRTEISLQPLPGPGIYFVRITGDDGSNLGHVRLVIR